MTASMIISIVSIVLSIIALNVSVLSIMLSNMVFKEYKKFLSDMGKLIEELKEVA